MATVSSSNMFNSYGISNKGIGGLASGLDTDSLMESLTAATRSKIAKQGQKKQLLNWKMTAYRGTATTLKAFQSKYLEGTLTSANKTSTNISSSAFFNTYQTTSASSKVKMTPTNSAQAGTITIKSIDQLATSEQVTGSSISSGLVGAALKDETDWTKTDWAGKTVRIGVGDSERTIKLDALQGIVDEAEFQTKLQELIDGAFGTFPDVANGSVPKSVLEVNFDGSVIELKANTGDQIGFLGGNADALGFDVGDNNRLRMYDTLKEQNFKNPLTFSSGEGEEEKIYKFSINGAEFEAKAGDTLAKILNDINTNKDANVNLTYSKISDTFTLSAKTSGGGSNLVLKDDDDFLSTLLGTTQSVEDLSTFGDKYKAGQNAVITMGDGSTLFSSTNMFSIDGISIELSETHKESEGPIVINTTYDADALVDKIKAFVEDYNALVDTLQKTLSEETEKDYEPLTDEQKEEMTQEQIDSWEKKAKKGILRNDSTVSRIVSDIRTQIFKTVDNAGISLFDIGINTMSMLNAGTDGARDTIDQTKSGKLQVDEEALKAFALQQPDTLKNLFTDAEDGIGVRLNTIVNDATRTSSLNRGSLVELAGTEAITGKNTSILGDKIDTLDKYITTLKARLETEYNRYWKQFSSLETAIQRMNAQSSWLTDM